MALRLIYQMLSKLLSRMVVHPRSDAIDEIEIWSCGADSPCSEMHPTATHERHAVRAFFADPDRRSITS